MKKLFAIAALAALSVAAAEFPFAPDKFTFLNIAPFSPGNEAQLAEEMIEYRERTGNDVVLYSLTLNPEGFPAMKKAEFLVDSYRKLKAGLAGSGVKLGVLIQATLGHWPRTDKHEEPWMRSITLEGKTKRFCPLDPGCRKYLEDVATLLAKEKPCFILWDDDVHASGSFGVECFCERHVAAFNAENGTAYTAETLREAVKNCKPGDKICRAFEKLQRDFVASAIAPMRAAIDRIDPTIGGGACMPYREQRFMGRTSALVAAKDQPRVVRIDNSIYCQRAMTGVADKFVLWTQAMCDYWKEIPYLLDESDTWPHNRWSMSAVQLDFKLKCGIFSGLKGSKLWFVNAHKGAFPVSRAYTDILAENREVYSALVAAVNGTELTGLWLPAIGGRQPWHPSWLREKFFAAGSWAAGMAGEFGVPFVCRRERKGGEICLLSGKETVEALTDDELKAIFAGKTLVDGAAAIALTARGLSSLTGVKAEAGDGKTPMYNSERSADGKYAYAFSRHLETPRLAPVADGAEILTELMYAPFGGSPDKEVAAPGSVYAKNALGGETVTTAFYANGFSWDAPWSEGRRDWFLRKLVRLGWNGYAVFNDQDVLALERRAADGSTLFAVFNQNFDPMKTIELRVPDGAAKAVQALGPDGRWHDVRVTPAARDGFKLLSLDLQLPCCGTAVLQLR